MPKYDEKKPIVWINTNKDSKLIYSIASNLTEIGVKVLQKGDLTENIVEISRDTAIFLLHKHMDLNNIAKIYNYIEEFLCDYSQGQILFHIFPREKFKMDVLGLFMKVYLDYGIGIIPTINTRHTVQCIRSLAKRVQIRDKPPSMGRVKPKFKTIFDAQKFLIQGLYDCGPQKAEKLMNHFISPAEIIHSLVAPHEKNLSGKMKNIMNIKDFGSVFLEKNKQLLKNSFLYFS